MMHNPVNQIIMEEVGLTVDGSNRVIDQDTREPILVKDKYLKYSQHYIVPVKRQEQIFDPMENRGQLSIIFDCFLAKLEDEGTPVDMYFEINDGSAIEIKANGQSMTTRDYNNESLKYVDAIMQLNGSEDVDKLQKYDLKKKPSTVQRKQRDKIDFTR